MSDKLTYAGIGSRNTPSKIMDLMYDFAQVLGKLGYTLRTGGAEGADYAFMAGASAFGSQAEVELYLPWGSFNDWDSSPMVDSSVEVYPQPTPDANWYVDEYHPNSGSLTSGARKLHARNAHQILGEDLDTPTKMVVCWTPDASLDGTGPEVGGTGQALRIASALGIPVLNLANKGHYNFARWCVDNESLDESTTFRL